MIRRPPQSRLRISMSWLRLWPSRGSSVRFWTEVAKLVKARRIRRKDEDAITRVCREVEYQWTMTSAK